MKPTSNEATMNNHMGVTNVAGDSRLHISNLLGIEPGSLMTGSKREIAGSPHIFLFPFPR
jgi:hypothetical protein